VLLGIATSVLASAVWGLGERKERRVAEQVTVTEVGALSLDPPFFEEFVVARPPKRPPVLGVC
jgi:hypothetical protein